MWYYNTTYLSHHGILGQKWGVRRYQNPDGTLTNAGKKRYRKETDKIFKSLDTKMTKHHNDNYLDNYNKTVNIVNSDAYQKKMDDKFEKIHPKGSLAKDEYALLYNNMWENEFNRILGEIIVKDSIEFTKKDKDYKKASDLISKYGKENLSDFSKKWIQDMKDLEDEYYNKKGD